MQNGLNQKSGTISPSVEKTNEGRYLYCIINSGVELSFGNIGIDDNDVYTIPYRDIAAVVHSCQARPYEIRDIEKASEWILVHNYVIDLATNKFGTVLPFSFFEVARGGDDTLKEWLGKNYDVLKQELERVKGNAEYSVQIFCDRDKLVEMLVNGNQELKWLDELIEEMPNESPYLLQRKLELSRKLDLKINKRISDEISQLATEFSLRIEEYIVDKRVDENTQWLPDAYKNTKLIIALSCLVRDDKFEGLCEALDEINRCEGFVVRFTGPWAPFSFVQLNQD